MFFFIYFHEYKIFKIKVILIEKDSCFLMFLMSALKRRKVVTEGLAAADAQMAAMKVKLK